ncbi:metallophosphoesterase family protein [Sphingomonas phyllosphaerae]|uniref:metallophosphoesterase family protein n=1 Tax=Sphingomonas phyllosphaerae TaxID=257003 RepID=UPI002FF5C9E6
MARSLTLDAAPIEGMERAAREPAERRPRSDAPAAPPSFDDKVILAIFTIGLIGNVVLQKIALPLKAGGFVPLVLPLFVAAIALGPILVRPKFDAVRIGGFFLAFIVASFSTFFLAPRYSASSLMLFAALYAPFMIQYETSAANYRRCMNLFITLMLGYVGVTLAQHLIQLAISWRAWPNLNQLLPKAWLVPDYVYIQPIIYGSRYMKPNAVSFLEVSLLSQFIALALAFELTLFRRPIRLIVLAAGLLMTLAGTGALLMALTLPVLLGRMRMRNAVVMLAILLVVCVIAFRLGWFDIVSTRMDEYKHNGTSANMRFILPLERLLEFLHDPRGLIAGIGAGQIEKGGNFIWWPFVKTAIEYGLVCAIIFYAWVIYCLFRRAPQGAIAFVLIVWFSFEGTLLTAHNVLSLVLFGTLLRVAPEEGRRRRDKEARPLPVAPSTAEATPPPSLRSAPPLPEPVPAGDVTGEALVRVLGTPDTGGRLIYAIGDLHGRVDLFDRLIARIRDDIAAHPGGYQGKPMVVLLGDYIDRGPASAQLIDRILTLRDDEAIEWRAVLGNHEDAMVAFLDARSSGQSWGRHGGATTLASYGVAVPETAEGWDATREQLRAVVPPTHDAWLRGLDHYIVQGGLIFVHAGLRPGVPLEKQRMKDILYIREEFLGAPVDSDLLIVHGHTPQDEAYGAPGRICLDSGAYATGVLTAARFDGGPIKLLTSR